MFCPSIYCAFERVCNSVACTMFSCIANDAPHPYGMWYNLCVFRSHSQNMKKRGMLEINGIVLFAGTNLDCSTGIVLFGSFHRKPQRNKWCWTRSIGSVHRAIVAPLLCVCVCKMLAYLCFFFISYMIHRLCLFTKWKSVCGIVCALVRFLPKLLRCFIFFPSSVRMLYAIAYARTNWKIGNLAAQQSRTNNVKNHRSRCRWVEERMKWNTIPVYVGIQ